MKYQEKKPPESVMAYYIKLYCEKKARPCKNNDTRRAVRSWMSLSSEEQQIFHDKYAKCVEKYKNKSAIYLKSVEPFLKEKVYRVSTVSKNLDRSNSDVDTPVFEQDINDTMEEIQSYTNTFSQLELELEALVKLKLLDNHY